MPTAASIAAILAAIESAASLIPQLIAVAQAMKDGASEDDIAKLDAAIARIQPINDAAFARVDAKLGEAEKRL